MLNSDVMLIYFTKIDEKGDRWLIGSSLHDRIFLRFIAKWTHIGKQGQKDRARERVRQTNRQTDWINENTCEHKYTKE